ncbi:MAG TPA: decaprenyl-phosphate phosphoribosyltransferase [Candidatus Latescibacteria bacterium]|nr:decaprenyl-phosphate phosphoribosyltransferase [Candidatus Latescibacterota bacterium]
MIRGLLSSLRPGQWTKNLFLFAGITFSRNLLNLRMFLVVSAAFGLFCLLSGSVYIFNDLLDRGRDRLHPIKRLRPIASGQVPVRPASAFALLLASVSLTLSFLLSPSFGFVASAYFALILAYSLRLKHIVIVDVMTVAVGFVLRAVAGAVIIDVPISPWLLICTVLLALFLVLGKRRHELVLLEEDAEGHRDILKEYSPYLLDQMIAVVTASTVMAYALYTISGQTVQKFGTTRLSWTLPFVLYGVFRYLYLIHRKGSGHRPEEVLLSDLPLLLDVMLWALATFLILYL